MRLIDRLPRGGKQLLMVAWDASSAVVCLWAAFALRLGTVELPAAVSVWEVMAAGIIVPPIFWAFGLYREISATSGRGTRGCCCRRVSQCLRFCCS